MSEIEANVPLQSNGSHKSYSTMEKKLTGEILNVSSGNEDVTADEKSALNQDPNANQVRNLTRPHLNVEIHTHMQCKIV